MTATAAPLPAIELPFYPPPSAGVARDAFPFLLAGIAGGLVLLAGFGAYLFARWRVRRLRFRPVFGSSAGQRGGLGVFGVAGEFGVQNAGANAGFFSVAGVVTPVSAGLVAAGSGSGDSVAGRGAFAAGLPVRDASSGERLGDAFELSLAPIHRPGAVRSASAFLLGLVPRRAATAEIGVAAFEVFEPVAVQSVSRPSSDLGLPSQRAPRKSALNFDLGLSAP
ncbi:hypothetical protein KPL76_05915 [Subtercola sp. PAMC28395]|uniref:hypothetical protein n=1 Tax=Subtercola sp. PAMC28395 TaxID=2846775 RepID=UPI001C0D04EA|nr:hypothetical protein [Subtercola sp. PAMC28395]QWT24894.1 hypothetical protein KPL76_05915 [Subtercola sp. PAMC28395]